MNDIPRAKNVLIFTLGTIEKLIDDGLVEGPKILTAKGHEIFAALKAEGFTPTEQEMQAAMSTLRAGQS